MRILATIVLFLLAPATALAGAIFDSTSSANLEITSGASFITSATPTYEWGGETRVGNWSISPSTQQSADAATGRVFGEARAISEALPPPLSQAGIHVYAGGFLDFSGDGIQTNTIDFAFNYRFDITGQIDTPGPDSGWGEAYLDIFLLDTKNRTITNWFVERSITSTGNASETGGGTRSFSLGANDEVQLRFFASAKTFAEVSDAAPLNTVPEPASFALGSLLLIGGGLGIRHRNKSCEEESA